MSETKYYPLTHPQKGIWNIEKVCPGTSIANVVGSIKINGEIEFSVLEQSINLFLELNDSSRLRIIEIDGNPVQYISKYTYQKFDFFDFSKKDISEMYKWDEEETKKPFKILESDLFYFALFKTANNCGGFLIKLHHFISDAWTMSLAVNQIMECYSSIKKGIMLEKKMKPSYLDYLQTEEQYNKSNRFQKDKDYWNNKFKSWEEPIILKNKNTIDISAKARRKTFIVPKKLNSKINEYCSENNVSEFALFLAALSMYINRVKSKEDLIFGTPVLNRSTVNEKNTVGMFTSAAVPIRIYIKDDINFNTLIKNISKEIMSTFRHQKYPYDVLLKEAREKHTMSDGLFDIVLSYQNSKFNSDETLVKYTTRWHFNGYQVESLIININDRDGEGHLIIDYDYLTELFHATEIEFIHQHIINILWHALDNPEKKISKLEMLSEKEKHKILFDFNNANTEYPKDKTVHQLFEEQVERAPDNIAAVFEDKQITYRELNEKANQLAHVLRDKGVKQDEIVSVIAEKSIETIISTFAILKAGGAYLPIDPEFPRDRIEFMLNDSSSKILLTQSHLKNEIKFNGTIILIDNGETFFKSMDNLENLNKPSDLIYIIYTSGSTGNPKGVMIEHKNVVRLLFNSEFQFNFNENDVWTMFHSYCFDFSVWEMYGALLYGGKLVIIPRNISRDTQQFLKVLKKHNVTILNQTPAAFYNLINEEMKSNDNKLNIRYVIFGGEALRPTMLKPFKNKYPDTKLINMYGITETTVHVTFKELFKEDLDSSRSNIGKAIPTLTTYIMDNNLNLLPISIPGEICVGGEGVARGYLNRPELTADKFIQNPYNPSERLYRTGDLARWYSKGDIEYLGRIDHQVKIRGYRVEIGEIENCLLKHNFIKKAVVIPREDKTRDRFLCAYFESDNELSIVELKNFLSIELPTYMIPSYFVRVNKIPLTSNGKIDKKRLPEPNINILLGNEYSAPTNEVEEELVKIWCKVLGLPKIGIDDEFFNLGGDSLTIIQILTYTYKFNWGFSVRDFYELKTIKRLAEKILEKKDISNPIKEETEVDNIEKIEVKEEAEHITYKSDLNKNVILTGVTGFLGIHILNELLNNSQAKIYCLIRGKDYSNIKKRLIQLFDFYFKEKYDKYVNQIGNRIILLRGDISIENFGLSETEYVELSNTIDSVIHAAALVKYFGEYSEFKNINVLGTQRVVDFCMKFDKKLNHISTIGIFGSYLVSNIDNNIRYSENEFYVGQNFNENVYVRSKFEAENVILKAMKHGLKASIYRMGNLTGRHTDGHFQINISDNAFYNTIKSLIELKAVSEDLLNIDIEFTPIDYAAKAVVMLSNTLESSGMIFHIVDHHELTLKALLKFLAKININLKVLSNENFNQYIEEISNDESRRSSLTGIISDIKDNKELSYKDTVNVESSISKRFLSMIGFEWPKIDKEYIDKIISYMKKTKFLSN